jgi:dTDP-4-dehydrorhamnose 3,5-epimerase
MDVLTQNIPGILVLRPDRHEDARGFFFESYNKRSLMEFGFRGEFVQDNISLSRMPGTIRGLHYQAPPDAQTKLVSVLQGSALDVAVDIRKHSPTFGSHIAIELSAQNGLQMFIPHGFAHGLCTLVADTVVLYKVDAFYQPQQEFGLAWNDPALGIDWPAIAGSAISDRDAGYPQLEMLQTPFTYAGA